MRTPYSKSIGLFIDNIIKVKIVLLEDYVN
jgi:hypothetical protein